MNGDGRVDLVTGNIGLRESGKEFAGVPVTFYLGGRNGRFRSVAAKLLQGMENRSSRIPAFCDYDNDGDLDLFLGCYRLYGDYFFQNNEGLVLSNTAIESGFPQEKGQKSTNEHTITAAWLDYDGDGDFDLCHSGQHSPVRLRRNDGNGRFTEVGRAAGVADGTTEHLGLTVGDFNNDGWPDLFHTEEREGSLRGASVLLINRGDGAFADATTSAGLGRVFGHGTACADFDGDGDLDLAVASEGSSADKEGILEFCLYRNELKRGKAWVQFRLKGDGKTSNRSAIGARVTLMAGGRTQIQEVSGGDGSLSQRPFVLHFGLGDASKIDDVTVRWPDGKTETIKGEPGRLIELQQGGGD